MPQPTTWRDRAGCGMTPPKNASPRIDPGRNLERKGFNRGLGLYWSMIFSENRCPPIGSSPRACFSGSCSKPQRASSPPSRSVADLLFRTDVVEGGELLAAQGHDLRLQTAVALDPFADFRR